MEKKNKVAFENHARDGRFRPLGETCQTLTSTLGTGGNNQPFVVEKRGGCEQVSNEEYITIGHSERDAKLTPQKNTDPLTNSDYKDPIKILEGSRVRRLTPLECERLQGYPDGWTNIGAWTDTKGKKHKLTDAPRYKALGNSIALPFWQWLANRITAQYDEPPTMGSLFDGIGGFPLVFSRAGCTPVWASEIEEFAIAVTKKHFPEDEDKEANNE